MTLKIAFGCDHAGYLLHVHLMNLATSQGYAVVDSGTFNQSSVDYPDYAVKVVEALKSKEADCGVLICGTGIGMSITANRYRGIRAAICSTEFEATMARQHNNANILCLGARVIGMGVATSCFLSFLRSDFLGDRHQGRVDKIEAITSM